jgi:hypothetical protein
MQVEGQELVVIQSLDFSKISIGVLIVEARRDGIAGRVRSTLFDAGLTYVGQISHSLEERKMLDHIDEVWVNTTFLRLYYPRSAFLASHQGDRQAKPAKTRPRGRVRKAPQQLDV